MINKDLSEILMMITKKVTQEVSEAYYNDNIDEVLQKYGFEDEEKYFCYTSNSKILVIGGSLVGEDVLKGVAKSMGILPSMIDFIMDFDKFTNYNFKNLRYNMTYSDVLIGPIPHKAKGVEGYSSFLAMARENPSEYPKIIELRDSNELKISKTSFKRGIEMTRLYKEL